MQKIYHLYESIWWSIFSSSYSVTSFSEKFAYSSFPLSHCIIPCTDQKNPAINVLPWTNPDNQIDSITSSDDAIHTTAVPPFYKNEDYEVISQHLLINLDLGPTLKCAPGHDGMEDSNIIKSY